MKWVALFGTVATVTALLDVFAILPPTLATINTIACWAATAGFTLSLLGWLVRGR